MTALKYLSHNNSKISVISPTGLPQWRSGHLFWQYWVQMDAQTPHSVSDNIVDGLEELITIQRRGKFQLLTHPSLTSAYRVVRASHYSLIQAFHLAFADMGRDGSHSLPVVFGIECLLSRTYLCRLPLYLSFVQRELTSTYLLAFPGCQLPQFQV